jgi:hypothetical protein
VYIENENWIKKVGYKELYFDLRVKKLHNYDKLFYSNENKTKLLE